MTKNLVISFIFSLFFITNYAQSDSIKSVSKFDIDSTDAKFKFKHLHSLQLEFLGFGGLYSLNYERLITNQKKWKTTASIGFSFLITKRWKGVAFPITINRIRSYGNNHLVLGVGATTTYTNSDIDGKYWDVFYMGRIGYRFQKPYGRFSVGAYYNPAYYDQFFHWGSISLGYSWR